MTPLYRTLATLLICTVATPAGATSIDNGVPTTITVDASMDNNFSVDVTDVDFGTIGITNANGQTAELIMDANGTIDETTGNTGPQARIVSNGGNAPGVLDIEGALSDQLLNIRYSNVQNLTCVSGCSGSPPALVISRIIDDATDQNGLWSVDDASPDASATSGQIMTSGTGTATVQIGVSIRTDGSGTPYPSGEYEGSFSVTLEY